MISTSTTLIEALWESLRYHSICTKEKFISWSDDVKDNNPKRSIAMFQILHWINWINPQQNKQDIKDNEEYNSEPSKEIGLEDKPSIRLPKVNKCIRKVGFSAL